MKRYHDIAGDGGSEILKQIGAQRERIDARLSQSRHLRVL
jgi:hypothetical protein